MDKSHVFVIIYKDGTVKKTTLTPNGDKKRFEKYQEIITECESNKDIKNSFYFIGHENTHPEFINDSCNLVCS